MREGVQEDCAGAVLHVHASEALHQQLLILPQEVHGALA